MGTPPGGVVYPLVRCPPCRCPPSWGSVGIKDFCRSCDPYQIDRTGGTITGPSVEIPSVEKDSIEGTVGESGIRDPSAENDSILSGVSDERQIERSVETAISCEWGEGKIGVY